MGSVGHVTEASTVVPVISTWPLVPFAPVHKPAAGTVATASASASTIGDLPAPQSLMVMFFELAAKPTPGEVWPRIEMPLLRLCVSVRSCSETLTAFALTTSMVAGAA